MSKARVAISFDDGRTDNYHILKDILIPSGLPCTVFVTTGYIDGSCEQEFRPTEKKAMSVENVKELFSEPLVEIGLHGDKHQNSPEDFSESKRKLIDWLSVPSSYRFGFSSPGSKLQPDQCNEDKDSSVFSRSNLPYIAVGPTYSTMRSLRIIARKAARLIPSGFLFKFAYRDNLNESQDLFVIRRVPIMSGAALHQVKALIGSAIRKKANLVLMFHSIEETQSDNWSWSEKKFSQLCLYLKSLQSKDIIEITSVRGMAEQAKND